MFTPSIRLAHRLLLPAVFAASLGCGRGSPDRVPVPAAGTFTKPVSFSILEDYDKGTDLAEVARDFALMRELGVRTWRGSFGWDDYEPERGQLDLAWLEQFAALAQAQGITLRPYVGYTAPWAAAGRVGDGQTWNDPPAHLADWGAFLGRLAARLRTAPAIASYEIYNEENVPLWWDGSHEEYAAVLGTADRVLADSAPDVEILPGGVVWPDAEWVEAICSAGAARRLAAFPFHAYPETWTPESVTVENYLDAGYREGFLPAVDACGARPVWINEMGYATTPGRTEQQQADWWARAVATFLAEPRVEHIGIYEIKDLDPDSPVIGDAPNYHLGLTRVDRTPKLAFHTVDLLTDLLDTGTLVVADAELDLAEAEPSDAQIYGHLFRRPDGDQVLFLWSRGGTSTVDAAVRRPAVRATEFGLDGAARSATLENGRQVRGVRLTPGVTRIFRLHRR